MKKRPRNRVCAFEEKENIFFISLHIRRLIGECTIMGEKRNHRKHTENRYIQHTFSETGKCSSFRSVQCFTAPHDNVSLRHSTTWKIFLGAALYVSYCLQVSVQTQGCS